MNIGLWLSRTAAREGARPALFLGRDLVSDYASFHHKALQLAYWLKAEGVSPGDRVAIFMGNCPDYLITLYGIWYAGAAAVPINAKLHGKEAKFILDHAQASRVFATENQMSALLNEQVDVPVVGTNTETYQKIFFGPAVDAPAARDPEDLAWLFYTSGTTGRPKGVMITHRMLITVSLAYFTDVDRASGADQVLYAAPMSHGAGLYNMLHVLVGAAHVCPASGGFDEAEIFDLAAHFGRVQMFAAPTMVTRMTAFAKQNGRTGDGLRTVVYAGGPMYLSDIIEAVEQFGAVFVQIYGQGECPMGITALSRQDVVNRHHERWRQRLAGVGRAQSMVEVRIGDEHGNELPPGAHGEIMVRGDAVMPGYWQDPEASAKALRGGWLRTGDLGVMDEEGFLTLQDRSKDLIISGGSNIYPREVEEALLLHPGVQEVSVIGRHHADWGEEVVAFVVGRATAEELDRHCRDHIARFKTPKAYVHVDSLPKNNYGKVLKTDLRKLVKPAVN